MKDHVVTEKPDYLYLELSEHLERMIRNGILKSGDKLISVRTLSRQRGISSSTVYKAYSTLEIKGLVIARSKSGYYVNFNKSKIEGTQHLFGAKKEEIACNLEDDENSNFSLSVPASKLLPENTLNRAISEAVRKNPNGCLNYESIQGNIRLRKQIAKLAFNWGVEVTENDIVTTQGCMEAIGYCLNAVSKYGDTIAIQQPTSFGIINLLRSLGRKIIEVPASPNAGVDLDALSGILDYGNVKACLFVPNFNTPDGSCMSNDDKKKLVEILAERNVPLIEDDVFGDIYFDKMRPHTCKTYDKKGLVLLCSSISKSLAPGYRVGWCLPGKYTEEVLMLKQAYSVCSTSPTHAAIALFFETKRFDLHVHSIRKELYAQSLLYARAISEYFPPGTKITQPRGGCVLWVELNKNVNSSLLLKKSSEFNIRFAPGHLFSSQCLYSNYIRIAFGAPYCKQVDNNLRTLGNLVRQELL